VDESPASPMRAQLALRASTHLGEADTPQAWRVGASPAQDRMVTFTPPGGGISWGFAYTNNGDLSQKGNGTLGYQFGYDLSSNLRFVEVTGGSASGVDYLIDGANRRIGRAVTSGSTAVMDGLLYDEQGRVVAELDGSNNLLSTLVYGLKPNVPDYMVRGGVTHRIVSDWRGDVRLVLNTTQTGAAAVVEQIDYDEWGNVTNLVDPACTVGGTALCWQPFGFAGGVFDVTTGIVRFGARDYDPMMRRWTQKDPTRFRGGRNLYVYVGDDPINRIDPRGLDPTFDECASAVLSAGAACSSSCKSNSNVLAALLGLLGLGPTLGQCLHACQHTADWQFYSCYLTTPPTTPWPPPPPSCSPPPSSSPHSSDPGNDDNQDTNTSIMAGSP